MAKLIVAKVYDSLMEEEETQIILFKNNKIFEASGLFFEWNEIFTQRIEKVLKEIDLSDTINASTLVNKVIELRKEFDMAVYKDSYKTLMHWQYMNGVTNEMPNYGA